MARFVNYVDFARLQISSDCYEINRNYDGFVALLKLSRSVLTHDLPSNARNLGFVMQSMVPPPLHLEWERHVCMPGLYGSFGDGATIQISAPEGLVTCLTSNITPLTRECRFRLLIEFDDRQARKVL
jgi:hypothetical protein